MPRLAANSDDTEIVSAQINGSPLNIDENGEFNLSVYVPRTGTQITVQALDKMGKISEQELFIERQERATLQVAAFDGLNPTKRRAKKNRNAIALIIGIQAINEQKFQPFMLMTMRSIFMITRC